MERIHLVSLILAARAASAAAQDDAGGDSWFAGSSVLDRPALVAAVLERNPSVAAARAGLRAARERPAQAGALDDLMVSGGFAPLSVGAGGVAFGQEVEVAQALPYPGKRRWRARAAAEEAEVMGEDLAALSLALAARAAELFDDFYLVHRALEINAENVALLLELQRVATARYAAGLVPQQDPLRAESELAHLLHDGVVLGSERAMIAAELNALLHRAPAAPLPPPPAELALPAAPGLDQAALEAEALAQRPELRRAAAAVRAREAELELARLARRPDFGVRSSYNSMWGDAEHRFMLGGSVALPVWKRRVSAAVAEAEARRAQAAHEYAALVDAVRREVFVAATRWRETHHVLDLFRSRLLPAAADLVQAAIAGFSAGQGDFLAVIDAERGRRRVQLEFQEALAELDRRAVALDVAAGRLPVASAAASPAPTIGEGGGR